MEQQRLLGEEEDEIMFDESDIVDNRGDDVVVNDEGSSAADGRCDFNFFSSKSIDTKGYIIKESKPNQNHDETRVIQEALLLLYDHHHHHHHHRLKCCWK